MQIRGEALESSHQLRITIRSYRRVMRTVAHVDSRGVRMHHFQTWVFPTAAVARVPSWPFGFATAFSPFSSLFSSIENEDSARPGDERFRKLSNGSKGHYSEALATRLVIASTGAMLIVGHEAPF